MSRGKATKARKPPKGPQSTEAHGRPQSTEQLPRALPPPAAAALVFVAAGAVLMLEILAVRMLAPYVGLTLETTTSIIGAVLGGIALGAAVGGYFADRTNTRLLIIGLLIGGGLLTLLTIPVVRWLGPGARGDSELAALGITLVALVPAASVLSAVSPAVAHLQLHDLRASGTIVGRLSAWATAGALVGTFGTGFVIVPLMPVSTAVLIIGGMLLLVGIAVGSTSSLLAPTGIAGVVIAALAFGALSATASSPCLRETMYHCLSIEADPERPNGYELLLDGGHHSYVDLKDPTFLDYPYARWVADAINATNPPRKPLDMVVIGGGAFTLPRWLDATRPGSRAEVLEVDGGVVEFDEERLGLHLSADMRASIGDARITMLKVESGSADVVVGDAYSGHTAPWQLTTSEWIEEVQRVLKPRGLYAMNIIDLEPLEFLKAEAATLLGAFQNVQLVGYSYKNGEPVGGNMVLLAANRPIPKLVGQTQKEAFTFRRPAVESIAAGAEPLRDDYAPVDQLRTFE